MYMPAFPWPLRVAQRANLTRFLVSDDVHALDSAGEVEHQAISPDRIEKNDAPRDTVLAVKDLRVAFATRRDLVHAVDGVSFSLKQREIFGLVGESGCGKSTALRSLIGLLPSRGVHSSGSVLYGADNILRMGDRALQRVRGKHIAMIFQDPMTYLNPVLRIHEQIDEALRRHTDLSRRERRLRAIELMKLVSIPLPERRLHDYPHQFSGGMRQRVLIAIALACNPSILLADEPTTALDVTVQDQVLKLLKKLRSTLGMSIVLVSHDLGVIAQTCDRIAVMYAGQIVEIASTRELLRNPRHPYTIGLLNSLPEAGAPDRFLRPIEGAPPNLLNPPSGCRFYARCPLRAEECRTWDTVLLDVNGDHSVRCLRYPLAEREGLYD
jgi:oligopeptide/dipeptide ABC transporter ATP-binding protein